MIYKFIEFVLSIINFILSEFYRKFVISIFDIQLLKMENTKKY